MTVTDEARALVAKPGIEWRAHEDGWRARELLAKVLELADLREERAQEWERLAQQALNRVAELERVRP